MERLRRRPIRPFVVAAIVVAAGLFMARSARSADPVPSTTTLNVGVADVQNILSSLREMSDLKSDTDNDQKAFQIAINDKAAVLQQLQQGLVYTNANTPQYTEKEQEMTDEQIKDKIWEEGKKVEMERRLKNRYVQIYRDVEDAIAQIAQKDGYNIVLSNLQPRIPDNLDNIEMQALQAGLLQRGVLYSDQSHSIDGEVIALMNKNYMNRSSGGPTTAPANP
jgi:Skp family chaperone for outer membrane proteins